MLQSGMNLKYHLGSRRRRMVLDSVETAGYRYQGVQSQLEAGCVTDTAAGRYSYWWWYPHLTMGLLEAG